MQETTNELILRDTKKTQQRSEIMKLWQEVRPSVVQLRRVSTLLLLIIIAK